MTANTTHHLADHRNDAVDRVAVGVKTALIVCAVGFVALVANRALVSPAAVGADVPSLHAASVSDVHATPAPAVDEPRIARPAAARDAEAYDGGDNHPPTF